MKPLTPSKYIELLDKFQQLSGETELTRQQITSAYSDLWSAHYNLLVELADLQIDAIKRGSSHA